MVRWLRWHCPPDTGFEIRALAVWGRVRYLSDTEAPHNTNFHTWMGKKQFCFFQAAETGNRTPDSGMKGSGANHYPRAPALLQFKRDKILLVFDKYCGLNNLLTLRSLSLLITIFSHLKLCLATATHNFKWLKMYVIFVKFKSPYIAVFQYWRHILLWTARYQGLYMCWWKQWMSTTVNINVLKVNEIIRFYLLMNTNYKFSMTELINTATCFLYYH